MRDGAIASPAPISFKHGDQPLACGLLRFRSHDTQPVRGIEAPARNKAMRLTPRSKHECPRFPAISPSMALRPDGLRIRMAHDTQAKPEKDKAGLVLPTSQEPSPPAQGVIAREAALLRIAAGGFAPTTLLGFDLFADFDSQARTAQCHRPDLTDQISGRGHDVATSADACANDDARRA